MKNLEPSIFRQRLIIEGHYSRTMDGETIRKYIIKLSKVVKMIIFSGPYSWPPDKWDNPDVVLEELNGFAAWTDSGVHVYAWRYCKFFTVDIYTCKKFSIKKALAFTKKFFRSSDIIHKSI